MKRLILLFAVLAVLMGIAFKQASARDPMDPNDCSRGIDEANQESCDLGGAQ